MITINHTTPPVELGGNHCGLINSIIHSDLEQSQPSYLVPMFTINVLSFLCHIQ